MTRNPFRSRPDAGRRRGASPALSTLALVAAMQATYGCAAESSPQRHTEAAFGLPAPRAAGTLSVEEAISTRRSVREFSRDPLSMDEIGQLFWSAQGITDSASGHRASPSAGALYPLEVYAVTHDGVYHYLPANHQLERVIARDLRLSLAGAALGQTAVQEAAVDFVFTGVVSRTSGKYGDRAERFVYMEAGHAAENMLLQALALGLGGVTIGGFSDDAVRTVLALPAGEQPLYIVSIGKPAR